MDAHASPGAHENPVPTRTSAAGQSSAMPNTSQKAVDDARPLCVRHEHVHVDVERAARSTVRAQGERSTERVLRACRLQRMRNLETAWAAPSGAAVTISERTPSAAVRARGRNFPEEDPLSRIRRD